MGYAYANCLLTVFCQFRAYVCMSVCPSQKETNVGWDGKLNHRLMAIYVKNIRAKNYQSLIIAFQVIVENVGMFHVARKGKRPSTLATISLKE